MLSPSSIRAKSYRCVQEDHLHRVARADRVRMGLHLSHTQLKSDEAIKGRRRTDSLNANDGLEWYGDVIQIPGKLRVEAEMILRHK